MIKEFKNGNIVLDLREDIKNGYYDKTNIEYIDDFYNQELTMKDYYFDQIDGYMYLVNYRTKRIYDFTQATYEGMNILHFLDSELYDNNYKLKLIPLQKKDSNNLFKILENEY